MRTKILLASAAALAAGMFASSAQVYSANVVGYCTVVLPAGPSYSMLASPFDDGKGNLATNWLDPNNTLPNKTAVLTWNGTSFNTAQKILGAWNADPTIAPGTGFFVFLPSTQTTPITNTFVGSVIVPSGGSITNVITPGYTMWGSPIPYAGDLVTNANLGNIGSLLTVNKSQILIWNGTSYNTIQRILGNWNGSAPINVGNGFFLLNAGSYSTNWVESATY